MAKKKTEMRTRVFRPEVRAVDTERSTVDVRVSDESLDRYNEVILTSAWTDGLDGYRKHPVLLSSHAYEKLTAQIGEVVSIGVRDDGLYARMKYYVGEGNEEADWGFKLVQKGVAAYSVGFKARKLVLGPDVEGEKAIPASVKQLKPRAVITAAELLEISHVLIPANPNAVQKALGDEEGALREIAELIVTEGIATLGGSMGKANSEVQEPLSTHLDLALAQMKSAVTEMRTATATLKAATTRHPDYFRQMWGE